MDSKIELKKDKNTDFSHWYTDIVMKTDLLSYYAVSGCYIMLPYGYKMWEEIQNYLDKELKLIGVENVYFPLLIPENYLNKESSHIEGFTPEVIWVSKTGTEEADSNNVKLCIRPTSETAIYPTFAEKIRSHADLPISWNQWCNVMRWEFSTPTPFIRSKEFLWQEGHSAFSNIEQVNSNVKQMLKIYKNLYEKLLGVPVIVGKKIESEKFAGAEQTFSIETFIPDANKSIQCSTVHNLGQNFSKMFNITFFNEDKTNEFAYQTSWGLTTRSIGTAIMTHSDNKGLVLSPYFAPIQIIIIPITFSKNEEINKKIIYSCNSLYEYLSKTFRVKMDLSDKRPGWKYNHWETKGVPFRIEIGPKDIENNTITLCDRINSTKSQILLNDLDFNLIQDLFKKFHEKMYDDAKNKIIIKKINDKNEILSSQKNKNLMVVCLCDKKECDEYIRTLQIKPICRPINHETLEIENFETMEKCIICNVDCNYPCYLSKTF